MLSKSKDDELVPIAVAVLDIIVLFLFVKLDDFVFSFSKINCGYFSSNCFSLAKAPQVLYF